MNAAGSRRDTPSQSRIKPRPARLLATSNSFQSRAIRTKKSASSSSKPGNNAPSDPTWNLSWRNVYYLGGRNIDPIGLNVGIVRIVAGENPQDNQEGNPYLQIFGLDRHTNGASESSPPDQRIDIGTGNEIPGLLLARGHLVFPFLEPFGEEGLGAPDLEVRVPAIYTETNSTNRSEAGRYVIRVRSSSRATEFTLGIGLIENSEVVRLNNRTLERDKDYTINYTLGRLKFIGDAENEASDPTADLDISYQNQDVFGGLSQSKSLVGFRFERPFEDQYSLIGMTVLYSNQSAPDHRVRVGQEPARTILWDANARFRMQPQFLTSLVNSIPLVNTQTPSSIDIDMEVAQSLPNPNTKNIAYIDDFEASLSSKRFPIGKLGWTRASTPTRNALPLALPQGRLTWYNPIDRDRASLSQIQPTRDDITAEQDIVDIFKLRFEPARSNGFPTRTRNAQSGIPQRSWAGITRYINRSDLLRDKFIELWIRGDKGLLHIDLGDISERVALPLDHPTHNDPDDRDRFPRGFRTEDKPIGGLPTGDDIVVEEEDTGLDGAHRRRGSRGLSKNLPRRHRARRPVGRQFSRHRPKHHRPLHPLSPRHQWHRGQPHRAAIAPGYRRPQQQWVSRPAREFYPVQHRFEHGPGPVPGNRRVYRPVPARARHRIRPVSGIARHLQPAVAPVADSPQGARRAPRV